MSLLLQPKPNYLLIRVAPVLQAIMLERAMNSGGHVFRRLDPRDEQPRLIDPIRERSLSREEFGHSDPSLEGEKVLSLKKLKKTFKEIKQKRDSKRSKKAKRACQFYMKDYSLKSREFCEPYPEAQGEYLREEWRIRRDLKKQFALRHPLIFDDKSVEFFQEWVREKLNALNSLNNYLAALSQFKHELFTPYIKTIPFLQLFIDNLEPKVEKFESLLNDLAELRNRINQNPPLNAPNSASRQALVDHIIAVSNAIKRNKDPQLRLDFNEYATVFEQLSDMAPSCFFKQIVWDRIYSLEAVIQRTQKSANLTSIIYKVYDLKKALNGVQEFIFREVMTSQIDSLTKIMTSQLVNLRLKIRDLKSRTNPVEPAEATQELNQLLEHALEHAQELSQWVEHAQNAESKALGGEHQGPDSASEVPDVEYQGQGPYPYSEQSDYELNGPDGMSEVPGIEYQDSGMESEDLDSENGESEVPEEEAGPDQAPLSRRALMQANREVSGGDPRKTLMRARWRNPQIHDENKSNS